VACSPTLFLLPPLFLQAVATREVAVGMMEAAVVEGAAGAAMMVGPMHGNSSSSSSRVQQQRRLMTHVPVCGPFSSKHSS
jgi:hypothetical protein